MCGSSLLSNWPGPSAGVPVSRRSALSVLVTSIAYQSSPVDVAVDFRLSMTNRAAAVLLKVSTARATGVAPLYENLPEAKVKPLGAIETVKVPMSAELGPKRATVAAFDAATVLFDASPNSSAVGGCAKVIVRTPAVPPSRPGPWVKAVVPGPTRSYTASAEATPPTV